MAVCPCKACEKRGCGTAHDSCPMYQAWAQERAAINARKQQHDEITRTIVTARLRAIGRRQR